MDKVPISIDEILMRCAQGRSLLPSELDSLLDHAQQDQVQAKALGYVLSRPGIEARTQEFAAIAPVIIQRCERLQFADPAAVLRTLWILWLPLAQQILKARQQQAQPFIQGILGGQGTGKTTLCRVLQAIFHQWNYPCVALSIDDLYKTYRDRQLLQKAQPELIWRGPPGTHDVELGITVLTQLQRAKPGEKIPIPRFDKSLHHGAGDRLEPEFIEPVEIILFEGWFVGCRPVAESSFDTAPEPIRTPNDKAFAQAMNRALGEYVPLWHKLDHLMVLVPADFHWSKQWRQEAEHQMIAQGKDGMSDAELSQFVDYFWRSLHPELFIRPLTQATQAHNLVIEIDFQHRPQRIYGGMP